MPVLPHLQPQQRRRPSTFLRSEGMSQTIATALVGFTADDESGEAIGVLVEELRQGGAAHVAGAFADALSDLEFPQQHGARGAGQMAIDLVRVVSR